MAARALYKTNYFCFQSVAASAIVLILPGWIIACGALELASRNIVSGSIRVVYALCYSMFLGFAISIGSDFISVLGPEADGDQNDQLDTVTLSGTFLPNSSLGDISNPMHEGSFTFTNTSAPAHKGNVVCIRHPDNPFYLKASELLPINIARTDELFSAKDIPTDMRTSLRNPVVNVQPR